MKKLLTIGAWTLIVTSVLSILIRFPVNGFDFRGINLPCYVYIIFSLVSLVGGIYLLKNPTKRVAMMNLWLIVITRVVTETFTSIDARNFSVGGALLSSFIPAAIFIVIYSGWKAKK